MAYVGDKLPLGRNDKFTLQPEVTYGTDPGDPTQDNIQPIETGSIGEAPEQIRAGTIRESRSMNRKDNTIWTSEGEMDCLFRGGKASGADTVAPVTGDARPEGIHHAIKAHLGSEQEIATTATIAGCTTILLKLDVGGGTNRALGDPIVWYDAVQSKILSRFVTDVSGDDVSIWPPLDAGDVPGAGEVVYGSVIVRQVGTKTLMPSLYGKFYDGDEIIRGFPGIVIPTMSIDVPLAEYSTFSFTMNGLRGSDPVNGNVPTGIAGPYNPNFPALGLDAFMMYYSKGTEDAVFPVNPLTLSVESNLELHTITTLESVDTPKRLRLGMREVTATLEVLYEDKAILEDFRRADRVSLIAVIGRDSYSVGGGWLPKSFNAYVIGLPQCSIDTVETTEHEDTKKLTIGLTAEPITLGLGDTSWLDKEFVLAYLGESV